MARILAVDDDALTRAVLADLLHGMGHETVNVGDVEGGLVQLQKGAFALIVSDVVLPGADGFELARRVAALPKPPPVILMSAQNQSVRVDQLRRSGIPLAGFIEKPLDGAALAALVEVALRPRTYTPPPTVDWSGIQFLYAAQGPIESVPPLRMLFLAHRVDAAGALVVERPEFTARVVLKGGRVVQVEGVPGLLRQLDVKLPDSRNLLVDVGAAVGAGHPIDRVLEAAGQALGEALARMLQLRGGKVRFDPSASPPPGAFPLPTSIPRLVASGLRLGRALSTVERDWNAVSSSGLRVRIPDDSPETRWGLDATAMRVLKLIPNARNVSTLIADVAGQDPTRRQEGLRALDMLYLLGMVVVDGGPLEREATVTAAGISGGGESSAAAKLGPPVSQTEEDPRIVQMRAALSAMEGAAPIDILDIRNRVTLTEEDAQSAWRELSRRYHPDTFYSAPPLVRALAEACFAKVNGALEQLRTPGGISEARRLLAARAKGTAFVSERDHVSARMAFKRGEVLFRNRDWKGADALFTEAVRLDPVTWPHSFYAIRAGALARRLTANEAVAQFDALQCPDNPRRAEVIVAAANQLKLEGRANEALRRFKQALELDPENRDAQRELRLHQTRSDKGGLTPSSTTNPSISGFFRRGTDSK